MFLLADKDEDEILHSVLENHLSTIRITLSGALCQKRILFWMNKVVMFSTGFYHRRLE